MVPTHSMLGRPKRSKRKRVESDEDEELGELQIGQIRYEDIVRSGRYMLPPDVKKAARRWMRTNDVVGRIGRSVQAEQHFSDLCGELGFLDTKYPEDLRIRCITKLESFIANEGARLRGLAFTEDAATGERMWAQWTTAWMEDGWDGETALPQVGAPHDIQQVDIDKQLVAISIGLGSLAPLLSAEQIERLLEEQFKLFEGSAVSTRVAGTIATWAETAPQERSVLTRDEIPAEAVHDGHKHGRWVKLKYRSQNLDGGANAESSGHKGSAEGGQKPDEANPGNDERTPVELSSPPESNSPSAPIQPETVFYGHFKTIQRL
ncbi:MAG: hypothetical protein M1839_008410 [Geoglossum umbratile]|nr:MAG: hypothetical protein M1839_008410 [Geoglossum umbratile]